MEVNLGISLHYGYKVSFLLHKLMTDRDWSEKVVITEDKVLLHHSYAQLEKKLGLTTYLFNKFDEATKALLINLGMTYPA